MDYLKVNGIEVQTKVGRTIKKVPREIKAFVWLEWCELPVGTTKMYEMVKEYGISLTDIRKIYEKYNMYSFRLPKPPAPVYRCRYEACQRNLIWHTDLHDFKYEQEYPGCVKLIVFIDDASRRVQGFRMLRSKTSLEVANALYEVLMENEEHPRVVWTDNGGEFMSHFDHVLNWAGIEHYHTEPYNPQQNGKVERFWRTADKVKKYNLEMASAFDKYNRIPHFSLPQIAVRATHRHMTPNECYERLPGWYENEFYGTWRVDNREYILSQDRLDEIEWE
jgi:hypothetical protein